MAKMTIYVSDSLKSRMDEVEGVNWSPIACRAFEAKLAEIITKKGVSKMQDVVTRLRASQQETLDATEKLGREHGRKWAMSGSKVSELKRLETEENAFVGSAFEPFAEQPDNAFTSADRFFFVIRPEMDGFRDASAQFWRSILEAETEEILSRDGFVQAFADGVLEVWDEVKDQL